MPPPPTDLVVLLLEVADHVPGDDEQTLSTEGDGPREVTLDLRVAVSSKDGSWVSLHG